MDLDQEIKDKLLQQINNFKVDLFDMADFKADDLNEIERTFDQFKATMH
jgi:hypothetical protein